MSEKANFSSKIGLVMATVGSAVGLGNVWRFPAETQANGGAAFLIVYVACTILLGIPVMLAEFSLGRAGRSDAVGAFRRLSPHTAWWGVGAVSIVASYLILTFYMVVAGWTLIYLIQSVDGGLYEGIQTIHGPASADGYFQQKMNDYICTDLTPLLATYGMIALNIGVLMWGVQKGIERLSNVLMPVLFVILLALCCVTLTLPDAGVGLEYFLKPDFSKITPAVLVNALGQTFFSLSLGMGILITYSAYYPADTKLGKTSGIVSLMSLLVAVLMGFIIFPAVTSFGLADHELRGATLIFVTLPEVFANLPAPWLWSTLFFVLLLVAALTSCVSIAEVTIAFMQDRLHLSRVKATLAVLLPLVALSALCSLSFGSLSDFTIFGRTIFDFLDNFATNILLPLVSIGVCVYVGWFAPKSLLKQELTNYDSRRSRSHAVVLMLIRYLAPLMIALILLSNFVEI